MKDFITVTIHPTTHAHLCEKILINSKFIVSIHEEKEQNFTTVILSQSLYYVNEPMQEIMARIEQAQK